MGLSRKLGATTQKTGTPVAKAVPYKWSNQTYTVDEIMKKFKLPCVVQCATDSCTVVWSDFQFDLRQPLLFYSKRSVQKIHAVSLKQAKDTLEEIGPPLAIPEDYEGWFAAAPKGVSQAKRHFRIEGVANSTARHFLMTTKCPAFTSSRDSDGNLTYAPHDVLPGEVLKRVCIMDSQDSDLNGPDLVKQHGPCLECLDEKGDDVVIPLSRMTMSYEISESYPDEESRIFQIASPMEAGNSKLPRIFTLVHGEPPLLAYTYTGLVRCYSVFTEETILAATLEDPGSRCLELATDSCVKFRLGLNEAAVKKTCEYTNAFQMCENFGAKFITGIKVSFTLKPDLSNEGNLDISINDSISDMQEVEANSEFDIEWGSVKNVTLSAFSEPLENPSSQDASPVEDISKEKNEATDKICDDESDTSSSEILRHRKFTEREIVGLMLKKGLMDSTDITNEEVLEVDVLTENRVTDNPLFYFFQQNSGNNHWPTEYPESSSSSSDESQEKDQLTRHKKNLNNPLAYLFEPISVQGSSISKFENPLSYLHKQNTDKEKISDNFDGKIITGKNSKNFSPSTSPRLDERKEALVSTSDIDVSRYDQVVCKTAKEYAGSDEDNNNTEEEDDDGEDEEENNSSENGSHISEMSNDNEKTSKIENEKNTSIVKKPPFLKMFNTVGPGNHENKNVDNSLLKKTIYVPQMTRTLVDDFDDNRKIEENDLSSLTESETDAVDDLFCLAEIESRRESTTNMQEDSQTFSRLENLSYIENEQDKSAKSNSVNRVHNLLDEVSNIVNTSSDRILDKNKTGVPLGQDIIKNNSEIHREHPLPTPRFTKNKFFTISNELKSKTNITADSNNKDLASSEEKLVIGNFDLRVKAPTFGDSTSVLRRSRGELNLAENDQENTSDDIKTSGKLGRTSPAESSISSILGIVKRERRWLDSANVNIHSHDHPHRQSSETEDLSSDPASDSSIKLKESYQFPSKHQRLVSLTRGNVLASVQSVERLNSTNDSTSTNNSSSLNNSFVHGVPELVVIGDTNIIMENKYGLLDQRIEDHRHQQTKALCPSDTDYRERKFTSERFLQNRQNTVSNPDQYKPIRFGSVSDKLMQIQNMDAYLHEDYV